MAVCGNCGQDSSQWGRPCFLSPTGTHVTKKEEPTLEGEPITLRDRLATAIYKNNDQPDWLPTEDGSPNSASYELADRVLATLIEEKLDSEPD